MMLGWRSDECLKTEISRHIFGSDAGHMLELAGSRDLLFRWKWSGLWSLGLFALAARNTQRNVGRIASQSFDDLPGIASRLIRIVAESNNLGVICMNAKQIYKISKYLFKKVFVSKPSPVERHIV